MCPLCVDHSPVLRTHSPGHRTAEHLNNIRNISTVFFCGQEKYPAHMPTIIRMFSWSVPHVTTTVSTNDDL